MSAYLLPALSGTLTAYGQAFAAWQPVSYSTYAPNVGGAAQGYP